MSAFIVEQSTINRIVTTIGLKCHWTVLDDLIELGYGDDLQALGRAMLNLNVDAVNQRYAEHTNPLDLPYRFRPEPVTDIQAFKSLECWLSHCLIGRQLTSYTVLRSGNVVSVIAASTSPQRSKPALSRLQARVQICFSARLRPA